MTAYTSKLTIDQQTQNYIGSMRPDMLGHALNVHRDIAKRIKESVEGCAGLNPDAYRPLLDATQAQHRALDWCLARLIRLDRTFMPSQSPIWPILLQGNAAIAAAQGE